MAGNRYLTLVSGVKQWLASLQASAGVGSAGGIVALNSSGNVDKTMLLESLGSIYRIQSLSTSVVASNTYAIGLMGTSNSIASGAAARSTFTILKSGVIKTIEYQVESPNTGTVSSTCSMQLGTTSTGTAISGTNQVMNINTANLVNNVLTGLSIAVTAGDKLQLQLVVPTGATSGTGLMIACQIYVESN